MKCKHKDRDEHRRIVLADPLNVWLVVHICADCGAWLSLGPSDEHASEAVEIELRAAHLAHGKDNEHEFTDCEWMGWGGDENYIECGEFRNVFEDMSEDQFAGWNAGYLARAIATHDGGES